jgi:hypothetical protein
MMGQLRPFIHLGIGLALIVVGLYAIDNNDTRILTFYVFAGSFGVSALIEKVWPS